MAIWGNRRVIKNIARKNRRADKLIRKGKFTRALDLMHEVLAVIEKKIGTTNIALAKQHLKLARFRVKEAKRAQFETSLQLLDAQIDRRTLSRSYTGRLVLRKLAKKEIGCSACVSGSELYGLLHFAEATVHGEKALEVLQQTSNPAPDLLDKAVFLLGKLYGFFEVSSKFGHICRPSPGRSKVARHPEPVEPMHEN